MKKSTLFDSCVKYAVISVAMAGLGLTACKNSNYDKFLEAAKKSSCKQNELLKKLEANPGDQHIKSQLKIETDWIDFYIKDSGDPEAFRKALGEHKCP